MALQRTACTAIRAMVSLFMRFFAFGSPISKVQEKMKENLSFKNILSPGAHFPFGG